MPQSDPNVIESTPRCLTIGDSCNDTFGVRSTTLDSISVSADARSFANMDVSENVPNSVATLCGETSSLDRRGEPSTETGEARDAALPCMEPLIATRCFAEDSFEGELRFRSMEYDAEDDRIGDDCLDLGGELLLLVLGAAADEGPAPLSAAAGASVVLFLGGVLDGGGTEILLDLRLLLVAFASTPSLIMIPVPFGLEFIGVLLLEDGPPAIGVGDDSLFVVNFCGE